ncbi:protein phosphatase 1 regulatory subunit 14C-like [Gigantopelta aegis]|uniref:protein phosphatase 1 regulatory subunit 14C-like n=1 Tax=Gigantopelta aegis TaxID=1735272 RepID=UPI001B88C614|nr:protein phosphatase 1 regulatory subunit 14C-like [Gigantopelta aegis]
MSGLNPFRRTVGFYEVMATSLPQPCEVSQVSSAPSNDKYRQVPQSNPHRLQGDTSPNNHVNFKLNREQEVEKKKKYFTAKYGQHQMMLIRKRLAVEEWVYEALRDLYDCLEYEDDHTCKLDVEDILNYDTDEERRQYAMECLTDVPKPREEVNNFVEELLKKANTL